MNKKLLIGTAAAVAAACLSFVVFAGGDKERAPARTAKPEPIKVASSDVGTALPDYDIIAGVRALGYIPTTQAFRRGPYYVLHARDVYGTNMRVVADAQLGDIVSIRQVFVPRYDAGPRIIHVPQPGEAGQK